MPLSQPVISAYAAKLAAEVGLKKFPFDPIHAARELGIEVMPSTDMQGASGAILLNEEPVILHPETLSRGLLNFTLGHEIGHYYISGHVEIILKDGGKHFSKGHVFASKKPAIELEADYFSANFLMPKRNTKDLLETQKIGLGGVLQLHKTAQTSITSSAIRATQCDPYPIAVILVEQGGRVNFSFRSTSFRSAVPGRHLSKGALIPTDSAAYKMSMDDDIAAGERATQTRSSYEWFGEGSRRLDVETYHLGKYGTIVVLTGEEKWEDDEEEEVLIENWTPRFKK